MKKIFTIAMVIALVAAFTVPAMAETKFSFKGTYRVRGFLLSNPGLQADQLDAKATGSIGTLNDPKRTYTPAIIGATETASQSWMDMRFRMESTFTVSERLAVVTRFDALDNKKYGESNDDWTGTGLNCQDNNNIDFDRAYMVVGTDFGKLQAGSMAGGTYGNVFRDSVTERDRVRFDTKLSGWIISLVYEKQAENDSDTCNVIPGTATWYSNTTDADDDWYYVAGTYLSEDISGGLLLGYSNGKNNSDRPSNYPLAPTDRLVGFDTNVIIADPFINANFGDFNVKAEGQIFFGKAAEFDRDLYARELKNLNAVRKSLGYGQQPDVDFDAYAYNVEGSWASGPFGAEIGYAYVKGDNDPYDDKNSAVGGVGDDWGKAFILTNTDSGFEAAAPAWGGLGAHAGAVDANVTPGNLSSGSTAAANGMKMFYLGGSFSPMENLKISALYANSKSDAPGFVDFFANSTPRNSRSFASDHGSEYDLTINWDIYDNLNYTFIAAYLDAGDYWQFGNPYRELENTYCFWQQLELSF
ncbi:MAG: hypothetical protein JEZ02_19000 [Desulfatibacillum sp.]|nr:hypothetical protein [Desulfatibacillum sp.]